MSHILILVFTIFHCLSNLPLSTEMIESCSRDMYEGRFFYIRRKVDLMKTAKVNAYNMHIFGKIELLYIHAT